MMSEQQQTVFTVAEAAKLLKKSPKRIRVYIQRKYFKATKPEGFGNYLIDADSLRAYIGKGFSHAQHNTGD